MIKRMTTAVLLLSFVLLLGTGTSTAPIGTALLSSTEVDSIPMVESFDEDWNPGVYGAPPDEVQRTDWGWEIDYYSYSCNDDVQYVYTGVKTVTDYERSPELHLDGPAYYSTTFLDYDYVAFASLRLTKVSTYVPFFCLEREPWYTHKLIFQAYTASTREFTVGGLLGIGAEDAATGLGGSGSATGSHTIASTWGSATEVAVEFTDANNPVDGVARSLVVFVLCTFIHASGIVQYYNGEIREYDELMLATIEMSSLKCATDPPERPDLKDVTYLDTGGDGVPDPCGALLSSYAVTYFDTKKTSWSAGFRVDLGKKAQNDGSLKPLAFDLSLTCTWAGTQEAMKTITHVFTPNVEPDDKNFMDQYNGIPRSLTRFFVRTDGWFNVNLETVTDAIDGTPLHKSEFTPSVPQMFINGLSMPTTLNEFSDYQFSFASSYNPVLEAEKDGLLIKYVGYGGLHYWVLWGDGRIQRFAFTSQGVPVIGPISFISGTYDVKVIACSWYGDEATYTGRIVVLDIEPYTPGMPNGRDHGYVNVPYTFNFVTTDAHGYDIVYEIDWGDGSEFGHQSAPSGVPVSCSHAWTDPSNTVLIPNYEIRVRAKNEVFGLWSSWSDPAAIVISIPEPSIPSIGGPSTLVAGTSGSFWAEAHDPAGVQVRYKFFWSDGTSWTSGWVNSGTRVTTAHSFTSPGSKSYWVTATNTYGAQSTADPEFLTVTNTAPNTPSAPTGPSSGETGTSYTFNFVTTDPNGHSVRYQVDWGDGSTTTTGYYSSGVTASASHTWTESVTGGMNYYVKVRAQDAYGAWSAWSSAKVIHIDPGDGGIIIVPESSLVSDLSVAQIYATGTVAVATSSDYAIVASDIRG